MKKALLILFVLLASAGILSAHDGSIGITLAPESYWFSGIEGTTLPDNFGMTRFYLMADGSNYFGDEHSFGIDYGIGALFSLNMWVGNITQSIDNAPVGLVFYLGPGYRYEFSDLIGISAGLGLRGSWISSTTNSAGYSSTTSEFDLELYGKASVDFTLIDFLRIDAGLMMGGPVYANMTVSGNGNSQSQSVRISGFFLTPFVGVSYVY